MDVPAARVTLLDGFTVQFAASRPSACVRELPHGVQRVIALICLARRVARTAVAGSLWPEVPEARAHGSLRSALWRLQKSFPGLILASGNSLALADGVRVDVQELSEWARRALDARGGLDEVALPEACLGGQLLPGWYDDWVLLERERLRQLQLHALEATADRLVAAGRYGDALEVAYAAVRAEPLRESAHRTVVRAHLAEGNVGEALQAFDQFRQLLEDELGVPPTGQMSQLVRGIARRSQNAG